MTTLAAFVRSAGDAQTFHMTGASWAFLLRGEENERRLSAALLTVPPDIGPPPHVHQREDEYFYVIEGEVDFLLGSDRRLARVGDFVYCPRGVPHGFMNRSARPAVMLALSAPGNLDRYIAASGTQVMPGTLMPYDISKEDVERMMVVSAEHGIEFLT